MKNAKLFLKITIIFIVSSVLLLSLFGLYWLTNNKVNPNYSYIIYSILIGIYMSLLPFLIALFSAFKLLKYIDKNKAFSIISIKALNNMKYCSISFSFLYLLIMPFIYLLADKDDAPGLIIIGLLPIFASIIISVFSAILKNILQQAIKIKPKNNLTV